MATGALVIPLVLVDGPPRRPRDEQDYGDGRFSRPPRSWAERTYNLTRYTAMPRGGHFAAHEEPELLGNDLTAFFRTLR